MTNSEPRIASRTTRFFHARSFRIGLIVITGGLFLLVCLVGTDVVSFSKDRTPEVPELLTKAEPLNQPAENVYSQANSYADHNQRDKALALFASIAQYAPSPELKFRALLLAGTLLHMKNDSSEEARQVFAYFLKKDSAMPGSDVARFHLAIIALRRHRPAEADSYLIELMQKNPDSTLVTSALAIAGETVTVLQKSETKSGSHFYFLFLLSTVTSGLVLYLSTHEHIHKGDKRVIISSVVALIFMALLYVANDRQQQHDRNQLLNDIADRMAQGDK